MAERYEIEVCSRVFLDGVVKDISRIRQWIAGFEAAGGKGPIHQEALWRTHQILSNAQRIEAEGGNAKTGSVRKDKSRVRKDAP